MTITDSMKDVLGLAHRFQEGELFRRYLKERMVLIAPFALLMLGTSLAFAFGIVAYIGGTRSLLVLLSLLIAPFVLIGSLLVQVYLFLGWLENRALAQSLGRRARSKRIKPIAWLESKVQADLGSPPAMPWLLVGIFIALPLLVLLLAAPKVAVALIVLQLLAPIGFARLDR